MAICAIGMRQRCPSFLLMAIKASHGLVGAHQRKIGFSAMVEARFGFWFFPNVRGVAFRAVFKNLVGRSMDIGVATDAFGIGTKIRRAVDLFFGGRMDAFFFVTIFAFHVCMATGEGPARILVVERDA